MAGEEAVGEQALNSALAGVSAAAAGANEGIFGPESLFWHVNREAIVFLGAGRALLLQLAHPWVAAAIAEHSSAGADPFGRFHRTFGVVYTMVFGSLEAALAAAHRLHARHATINGSMPHDIGPFARGSPYRANDIAALRWVYATLIDTAALAYGLVLPPLNTTERERYYTESRLFAALFGIAESDLPADWAAFAAYNEAMWNSETLRVSDEARAIAQQLFLGASIVPRTPRWYRAITAMMMPERLRVDFGLPFGEGERRRAARAIRRIRQCYPLLPMRLRLVAPYHEAMARLSGSPRADIVTRLLNRLWIGRPLLEDSP